MPLVDDVVVGADEQELGALNLHHAWQVLIGAVALVLVRLQVLKADHELFGVLWAVALAEARKAREVGRHVALRLGILRILDLNDQAGLGPDVELVLDVAQGCRHLV